jgi:hypothetical protein
MVAVSCETRTLEDVYAAAVGREAATVAAGEGA